MTLRFLPHSAARHGRGISRSDLAAGSGRGNESYVDLGEGYIALAFIPFDRCP